jgi:hypothetical protein
MTNLHNAIEEGKGDLYHGSRELHVEDRVTYYRDIAAHSTEAADQQQQLNDDHGVPEREKDQ